MQTIIPTTLAVGCGVGDIFPAVRPLDLIAFALHQFNELISVDGVLHTLVDLNRKSNLPALAAHRGVILRLLDPGSLMFLRLTDGQTVTHTDLV